MSDMKVRVTIPPLAMAAILDMLTNIAKMLESGMDPLQVARQIRALIAKTENGHA